MKAQALNFSRQLAVDCARLLTMEMVPWQLRESAEDAVRLHGSSQKFLLPHGGRLLDDKQYRALDETQPLRLPYPAICLEYESTGNERPADEPVCFVNGTPKYESSDWVDAPKRVVYAEEIEGWVQITTAFWVKKDATWRVLPRIAIPVTGFLDRSTILGGRVAIKYAMQDERISGSDYMDELGALLCFLNALQCSNVGVERAIEPRPVAKRAKDALPFDAYHVLTVEVPKSFGVQVVGGGTHRSPREHLRRGHIRRLSDGRRIWVNAAVIGRGAASLHKSYAVREAA